MDSGVVKKLYRLIIVNSLSVVFDLEEMTMKRVLSALLVLVAVSAAQAADYNWTVNNLAIPDNVAAGVNVDLVVNDFIPLSLEQNNCVEVTLSFANLAGGALGHTWAGDIVATLTKVGDGTVNLINRVGRTTSGFGDSSDLRGPYTFTNKAPAGNIWTAAATAASTANIPAGLYRATGANAAGAALDICAPFIASGSIGTWRLNISDQGGGDTGVLTSASLTLKPEPSTLALVGLGVVALIRRRK